MSNKQVDFLVKIRDGLAKISEAANEYIDSLTPREVHEEKAVWNPERIIWVERNGKKGIFQVSTDYNNSEYKAMLRDIRNHGCAMSKNGIFYWIFENGSTVGRKKWE